MRDTPSPAARRALAAIMFADMVGYSALMAGDEARAYEARVRYRRALATATERHGGEVIQHYGDGSLTLFSSAVEAARAAVLLQRMLQVGEPVPVRIGLHLADVVRDDEGVYGSGVNVAARIESLAAPGSVVISDRVARELSNQPGIDTIALGTVQLKNIKEPMDVYALDDPALVIPGLGDVTINAQRDARADKMTVTAGRWISKPSASASASPACPPCEEEPTVQGPLAALLYELHRRRVFRVVVGYLVLVMGTLTGLEQVGPSLGLPGWVIRAAVAVALLGLPVTVALAWVYDVTPRGILRTGRAHRDAGRLGLVAASVLLVGSGVLAAAVADGDATIMAASTHGGAVEASAALAVLPLSAIEDHDDGIAEALHESLVTRLGRVPGLPVLSHASVESYDAASAGPDGVRRLGATLALEGCVRRVGGKIRVLVRLVDAEQNRQLWSARFDRDFSDDAVLELESDIADAVAEGLEELLAPRISSPVQAAAYVGA